MLTDNTKLKIAQLFLHIYQFESGINDDLKLLRNSNGFNPEKIFKFFDQDSKGYVDAYDFLRFFKDNMIHTRLVDVQLIFSYFGINKLPFHIFLDKFLKMKFYPAKTLNIPNSIFSPIFLLTSEQVIISNILQNYLDFLLFFQKEISSLQSLDDFNFVSMMEAIGNNKNHFTSYNLQQFLSNNKQNLNGSQIVTLLNSGCFTGNTETITSNELVKLFITPFNLSNQDFKISEERLLTDLQENIKQEEEDKIPIKFQHNFSLDHLLQYNDRNDNEKKESNQATVSNTECNTLSNTSCEFLPVNQMKYYSYNTETVNPNINLEQLFVKYLSSCIKYENELEKLRNCLVFQEDFNLKTVYRFFDTDGAKEYISHSDLIAVFRKLGVKVEEYNMYLITKRFCSDETDKLVYKDFEKMFLPQLKKDYAELMLSRKKNKCDVFYIEPEFFDEITLNFIRRFICTVYEGEHNLHQERTFWPLSFTKYLFDYLVPSICKNEQRFITFDEFNNYLKYANIIYDQNDFKLLCFRLDRKNNGYISFDDLQFELTI